MIRLTAVHVAGLPYRLLGTIRPRQPAFTNWVAYDSRGSRLGSGSGDPLDLP